MTKKLLFFTAGALPTEAEAATIAGLQAASERPFEVIVRRGDLEPSAYKFGSGAEAADYVVGTPPATLVGTDNNKAFMDVNTTGGGAGGGTLTIGAITYTIVAVPAAANEVAWVEVGDQMADFAANLFNAINGGPGEGVVYGAGTVAHPTVEAVNLVGNGFTLQARTAGEAGNAIEVTSATDFYAKDATLLGGGYASVYEALPSIVTGDGDLFTITITTEGGNSGIPTVTLSATPPPRGK